MFSFEKLSNIKQGSVSVSNLKVLNRLLGLKVVTIIQSLTVITLRALLCWKDTSKSPCLSVFFFMDCISYQKLTLTEKYALPNKSIFNYNSTIAHQVENNYQVGNNQ